jgi:hypothetical protein
MGYDTGIATRLRNAGLSVVEVDGWQTRGSSSFTPRGSVNHHTAGPATGNIPSLDTLIYGRSDLPGPLCNVAQARNNDVYVIAAGRANHAGDGGWAGLSGNSSVWGLEVENVGTQAEPWRADQVETMARIHAALISGTTDESTVCQHFEWTTRKPDAHDLDGNAFRGMVGDYLHGAKPPLDAITGGVDVILYIHNPNRPSEIWVTDGMYKRYVKSMDEVDAIRFAAGAQGVQHIGEGSMGATDVTMDCWASIPVAPGTDWTP